jgi:hypothetical protein
MANDLKQTLPSGGTSMELNQLLTCGDFDVRQVGAMLDALDGPARLHAVRSLSGRAQAQLFEAAQGVRTVSLDDLVPPSSGLLQEVPHYGINSLLMFRRFAKVFCRPPACARELWGYNRSGGFVETFVGPGYYVAYETEGGEALVDYTRLPMAKPDSWPAIIPNEARVGRFVYANMKDVLRGVSRHVTIGRAIRNGQVKDNWFALCRAETGAHG